MMANNYDVNQRPRGITSQFKSKDEWAVYLEKCRDAEAERRLAQIEADKARESKAEIIVLVLCVLCLVIAYFCK